MFTKHLQVWNMNRSHESRNLSSFICRNGRMFSLTDDWLFLERPERHAVLHKNSMLMVSRPGYQLDHGQPALEWTKAYLAEDAEELQRHKQHHVHIMDSKGTRQPLNHCREPKDPTKCKAHFPREKWLTNKPYLVCPGLAKKNDMPHKGKKSMVGMPWGPWNLSISGLKLNITLSNKLESWHISTNIYH